MNQQLSNKIKVYNFIFTIGIVIYHWKNFSQLFSIQQNVLTDTLFILYDTIGYIALGIFFMNSGYLLYQGVDHMQKLLEKLKRRVSSLIVPFLTWNALMLAYQILYCFYSGKFNITLTDLLLGFSFVPFDGPLWYIFALVLLMSLSPLIIKLGQYPKVFGGIVATVCICAFLFDVFVKNTINKGDLLWLKK